MLLPKGEKKSFVDKMTLSRDDERIILCELLPATGGACWCLFNNILKVESDVFE